VVGVLAILVLSPATGAFAALQITEPSLQPVAATDFAVQYRLYAYANGQNDHTRSEGVVIADSVTSNVSGETLSFQHDYPRKTKHLSLPTNPPALMILQRGATYNVRVGRWIAGGGGCSTCDEEGSGGSTTITVPSVEPKDRLTLDEKLKFSQYSDAAFDRAWKLRLMTLATFTHGAADALFREAYRETLAGQQMRNFALDPVDRHYRKVIKARRYPKVKLDPALGTAAKPIAAVLDGQAQLAAEMEAATTSINRAQGAFVKHKTRDEKVQMLAAASHSKLASSYAGKLATALDGQLAALRAQEPAALDAPFGPDQAIALSDQVRAGGALPAADLTELRSLHATAPGTSFFTQVALSGTDLGATTPAAVLGDPSTADNLRGLAATLRGFAKRAKRAPTATPSG
jgi:hypothetical protein